MRHKKSKQKRFLKFRLLLDSAFAKPATFKKAGKKASIKHIRHDFNLAPQTEDKDIYNLAVRKGMFVVTIDHDFKKFVQKDCPGVLVLNSGLTNLEIDNALSSFIHGKNPKDFYGKATKIK